MNRLNVSNDEIVRMWEAGLSTEDIAEEFQCSRSTIWKRLKNCPGLKRPLNCKTLRGPYKGSNRGPTPLKPWQIKFMINENHGRIFALHRAGWTAKEIAEDIDLRLDPKYIEEVLRDKNL